MKFGKIALSLAVLVTACGSPPPDDQPGNQTQADESSPSARIDGQALIFEFPDGVRGGRGRIQGDASLDLEDPLVRLELLRECGAVTPRADYSWSHYTYVLSRSTAADRDVIECFKRNSSDHFNVGIGVDDPETGFEMETAPFEEFIAAAERETEEVFFEIPFK